MENSVFSYKKTYYLQICGSAIGSVIAPMQASITMASLEKKLYTLFNNIDDGLDLYLKQIWFRYLDDCFAIINPTKIDVSEFILKLGTLHTAIKFTSNINDKQINFLDISVIKIQTTLHVTSISTDIYYKKN